MVDGISLKERMVINLFTAESQTTLQWSVVTGLIVLWEMMSYAVKYHHTHLIVRALLTV